MKHSVTEKPKVSAAAQLKNFIAKFDPKNQALIRGVRKAPRQRLPTANELVYDNYNFFVIGYCSSERPSDCIVSIAAAANGVGLSFYHGASLPDPSGILEGSGKQNRFIRLPNANRLRELEVLKLILLAAAQGKTKLPVAGSGHLVIKSVSEKQKPRRRAKSAA